MVDVAEDRLLTFFAVIRDDLRYLDKIGQKPDLEDYPHLYKLVNYRLIDKMGKWVNKDVSLVESLGFIVTRIDEEVHLILDKTRLIIPLDKKHVESMEEDSILQKLLCA